jgi:hypothetical protein
MGADILEVDYESGGKSPPAWLWRPGRRLSDEIPNPVIGIEPGKDI